MTAVLGLFGFLGFFGFLFLDWNQSPFHLKHFRHRSLEGHGDFVREENGWIRSTALDRHDRLPAHADAKSQLFLRHTALKTKAADVVVQDGGHGLLGGETCTVFGTECGGDCTFLNDHRKS